MALTQQHCCAVATFSTAGVIVDGVMLRQPHDGDSVQRRARIKRNLLRS